MKVLLTGCGAVGLGIAAALYDAGARPDLIAQGKTYEAIKNGGIERHGVFKEVSIAKEDVKVYKSAADTGVSGYDFVIVCCKTTASPDVAKDLSSVSGLLAQSGKIVLFQNGFDNDRPFLPYFDREAMCGGSIITGFERPQRNVSVVTVHSAPAQIGGLYGGDGGAKPLADAISAGGLPCVATDHILKTIWSKMLYNCTLNPLGAVLSTSYGGLAQSPDAVFIMNKIIEEIFSAMKAGGFSTYWPDADAYKKDFFEKILPPTYKHRASTLQDMERKIKTEIDTLSGVIVRLGKEHGIPVPFNEMIYSLVKAKESLYNFESEKPV